MVKSFFKPDVFYLDFNVFVLCRSTTYDDLKLLRRKGGFDSESLPRSSKLNWFQTTSNRNFLNLVFNLFIMKNMLSFSNEFDS